MKSHLPTLIVLTALAAVTGCWRELSEAPCPCLDGWTCCEQQDRCVPEGSACEPHGDAGWRDASQPGDAEVCVGERGPATRICPGAPFAFAGLGTRKATAAALVGRWQVCNGTGFRWGPEYARSGIEFTRDGKFYMLGDDDQGALQRVIGLRASGTYYVDDRGSVYFTFPEGGGASFYPSFDAQKAHLHAGGDSGSDVDYVRVPQGAGHVPGVVVPGACRAGDAGADATAGGDGASSTCEGGVTLACPGGPFNFELSGEEHDKVAAMLVGRWQLCQGAGLGFGSPNAQSGMEFTRDGKFYLLGESADGALQRVVGLETTAKYQTLDIGQYDQVELTFSEGGSAHFLPAFDAERNHFYTHAGGNDDLIYTRVPVDADRAPVVRTPVVCETQPDAGSGDAGRCEPRICPGGPFAFARLDSQSATLEALVGRWQHCEGTGFQRRSLEPVDGVEFSADGRFYFLETNAQGALQRSAGLYSTAPYVGLGIESGFSVAIEFPEGLTSQFASSFDDTKAHLHIVRDLGARGMYVRLQPEQTSVPGLSTPASCQ